MKGKWASLLAFVLVCPLTAIADDTPSPELLELLGQFTEMEELGVDVQSLIDERLQLPPDDGIDPNGEQSIDSEHAQ